MKNEHFELGRWVDFARGLVSGSEHQSMQAHLDDACEPCLRTSKTFGTAATAGRTEDAPPPAVTSRARSIFKQPHPEAPPATKSRHVIAQLILDTSREPVPVGMRAGERPTRLLFAAGEYFIDLDLARDVSSATQHGDQRVLVGQIVNRQDPSRRIPELGVLLESDREVQCRTETNSLGEFELQYDASHPARLRIPLDSDSSIEISLPAQDSRAASA